VTKPRSSRQVDPKIAHSWTLPAGAYTDAAVLAREQELIFARTWQIVGRSEQVRAPGDYFCCQVAGRPVLVVRGTKGELRAFYNVCRHRAGPPAEGCGSRKVFRCGYHGWTYGLDGRLLNAPEMEGAANFQREDFGLLPVRVEEWSGLIFVNLDHTAPPLSDFLGDMPAGLARFGFERMRLHARREYRMRCNWKTYIDNYLEGYHLPSVHPSLNRELDYSSYVSETYPHYSRQWSPIRPAKDAGGTGSESRRYQSARKGDIADYYWVFPNWMLNCYPDNVSLNIVQPLGVDETVAIFEWYFPDDVTSETREATVRFSDEIQLEDGAICEKVQSNLSSGVYQRGRFSPKQERCVHHFQRMWEQWMANKEKVKRKR